MNRFTRYALAFFGLAFASNALAAEDSVKKLTAMDLAVQTHKWDGKKIEVQLRCFYADKDEYRCATGMGARVDFTKISNEAGKDFLDENCDTLAKVASRNCMVTVRFTYSGNSREASGSGQQMTVVQAEDDTGEIVPNKGRKRR